MNFTNILIAIAVLGAMGAIFGAALAFAAKIFHVEVDPKEAAVRECLAGANCGGCGFPGCDGYAKAVAEGKAPTNKCVAGGPEAAAKIAEIMGVSTGAGEKMVAWVPCHGCSDAAVPRFEYNGPKDCQAAMLFGGKSNKECTFACIGLGNCERACKFDAMHVVNGVAKVDRDKCVGCGMCANTCPQKIIDILPKTSRVTVGCSSKDLGKNVTKACKVGCIGCKMCEKTCKFDAIHVVDNLAKIDPDKCKNCGMCAKACPRKIIHVVPRPGQKPIVKVAPKTEDGAAPVKPSEITRPEAPAPGSEPEKKTE